MPTTAKNVKEKGRRVAEVQLSKFWTNASIRWHSPVPVFEFENSNKSCSVTPCAVNDVFLKSTGTGKSPDEESFMFPLLEAGLLDLTTNQSTPKPGNSFEQVNQGTSLTLTDADESKRSYN
jgi:hypothetical protein